MKFIGYGQALCYHIHFLTGHCPSSHPISFDKKRWCCKERQRSSTCDGSGKLEINDTMKCCEHPMKCGMPICKDANGENLMIWQ